MGQLFSPRADIAFRAAVVGAVAFGFVVPFAVWAFVRSPAATGQYRAPEQPVPFSHPLHVNGLRIGCLYCHPAAERASVAGLPPTASCVPCHKDGLLESELFAPVARSLSTGQPIPWRRVNQLPDFVFFNHAVHVRNGVQCPTCHGPVHLMSQVYQVVPLTMQWCLECHRAPERHVGSAAMVTLDGLRPMPAIRYNFAERRELERLTSCTTCHR